LAHGGKDLKSNPEGGSGTSGLEPPRDHLHTLEILAKLPNCLKLASLKQCICRAVLWERMRVEGVSHGLNRDIPDEIRNFWVMKFGTSGFHSALAKNLEMRDLASADCKFQVLRYP